MGVKIRVWGEEDRFANYVRAIAAAGGSACFGGESLCDGLLLPGGGDLEPRRYGQREICCWGKEPCRDEEEMMLIDRYTAAGKPVLGICRGMQSINVYFGGTLIQDIPGHNAVNGSDRLHKIRSTPAAPAALRWRGDRIVNSAHHQAADRLGSGLLAVQWSPDGVIEAICHRILPVWGVQWHPERLCGRHAKRGTLDGNEIFRAFVALCVDEMGKNCKKTT